MSKYAVYEIFGDSAPYNVESCGHLVGARVGTSDKNPLDISDTTYHTDEPVRCKECCHAHKVLMCDLGCGEVVGPDDFCSWGEPVEDGDSDGER